MSPAENTQKTHFEQLHDAYESHYYDKWSMRYRDEFIYGVLWGDLDLNGKDVAELACGSGHNTEALLKAFPRANVVGFDISPPACRDYSLRTGMPAHQVDLMLPLQGNAKFDVVFIIGGLHHCVRGMPQVLENVGQMLKPGGLFLMQEPNAGFFLEAARKVWYRNDKMFDAENEAAIDHDIIFSAAESLFVLKRIKYSGGPAYFLVLQSMILRIPRPIKNIISAPLIATERLWDRLPGRRFHNTFLARWQRL